MSDALPLEPKSQFKNWHEWRPIKELDDRGLKMVKAMTFGVDEAEAAELDVAPYWRRRTLVSCVDYLLNPLSRGIEQRCC